jgi:phosphoglycolate phosphatase
VTIALVVFDLDGTLADSKRDLANAANATIASLGGAPLAEDAIAGMVGEGAALLVRRALIAARLDPDTPRALDLFLDLYHERLLDNTVLYAGMADVLRDLSSRVAMSVLTNKPSIATEKILAGLGVRGRFRDVIGGDTRFGRKPDPAGLLELIARANATPATTMMVGDSRIDLETARSAGAAVCLARYGFGYRFQPGDFRGRELFIDAPGELESLIPNH